MGKPTSPFMTAERPNETTGNMWDICSTGWYRLTTIQRSHEINIRRKNGLDTKWLQRPQIMNGAQDLGGIAYVAFFPGTLNGVINQQTIDGVVIQYESDIWLEDGDELFVRGADLQAFTPGDMQFTYMGKHRIFYQQAVKVDV
jgi:hypothetical protein